MSFGCVRGWVSGSVLWASAVRRHGIQMTAHGALCELVEGSIARRRHRRLVVDRGGELALTPVAVTGVEELEVIDVTKHPEERAP